jgi:myosin heavy chain 9/10/11/14
MELQKNAAYIHSLKKSKTRLTGEAEDLARETEREGVKLKAKEKAAKAMVDVMKERRAKGSAEPACHSLI